MQRIIASGVDHSRRLNVSRVFGTFRVPKYLLNGNLHLQTGEQSSSGDLLCNIVHASGRITDPLQEVSHPEFYYVHLTSTAALDSRARA